MIPMLIFILFDKNKISDIVDKQEVSGGTEKQS